MQQEENRKNQEIISIEEYLYKRKRLKSRKNGICLPTKFQ